MSNLWACLAASDGSYRFDVNGRVHNVPAHRERMFDRWAMRYPFCPVASVDGRYELASVLWVTVKGYRNIELLRGFFRQPTVVYTRGNHGVGLWATVPTRLGRVVEANERLARVFKGRLMDAGPQNAMLDLKGCQAEWNMSVFYDDFDKLVLGL